MLDDRGVQQVVTGVDVSRWWNAGRVINRASGTLLHAQAYICLRLRMAMFEMMNCPGKQRRFHASSYWVATEGGKGTKPLRD